MSDDAEKQDRIAARAYQLWEKEGFPHGRDRDHWHQAEYELGAEPPLPAKTSPTGSAGQERPTSNRSARREMDRVARDRNAAGNDGPVNRNDIPAPTRSGAEGANPSVLRDLTGSPVRPPAKKASR